MLFELAVGVAVVKDEDALCGCPDHLAMLKCLVSGCDWRVGGAVGPAELLRIIVLIAPHLADAVFGLTPAGGRNQSGVVDGVALLPGVRISRPLPDAGEEDVHLLGIQIVDDITCVEALFNRVEPFLQICRTADLIPDSLIMVPNLAESQDGGNRTCSGGAITGLWGWGIVARWRRWLRRTRRRRAGNAQNLARIDLVAVFDVIAVLDGFR